MGRERHFQVSLEGPPAELTAAYGFEGSLVRAEGDYLLLADTSVNSTKLNLILEPRARLDLQLRADGSVRSVATYTISNPFPQWAAGRDPRLVSTLMFEGVYGCYLRVYAPAQAGLLDVKVDGRSVGPEQAGVELGRRAFGRFFPVLPGGSAGAQFHYETPGVVRRLPDGVQRYELYVQKQAGTDATPLEIAFALPGGATLIDVRLDGKPVAGRPVSTDLRTDRRLEVLYRLP
jgi:hypothetical protein